MNLLVFSIFDSKMARYSTPFFDEREASAIRNFSDWVNDGSNPGNMLFKHPEDFSLFFVGEFDRDSGELVPFTPKNLVTASALKAINNGVVPDLEKVS